MHGSAFRQHGYSNLQVIVVGDLNPTLYAVKNTVNNWVSSKRHATHAEAVWEMNQLQFHDDKQRELQNASLRLPDGEGNEE